MFRYLPIRSVTGREILDSRGNPTVEVEVAVGEGILGLEGHMGRAQVPSGASTGKFEALEKRDQEVRYLGQGVRKAVEAVNTVLADAVVGENALEQERIDHILCQADGTETKKTSGQTPFSVSHLLWRARRQMRFICRCTSTWAAATQAVCPCR